eukprot:5151984-Ditylum_brightwellii.AAC.1
MAKLLQVNDGKTLNAPKKTNKYSRRNADADAEGPKTLAIKELNKYYEYMEYKYLSTMQSLVVLGAINEGGQPKEPVYAFGPVIERVRCITDFKEKFPSLCKVIVDQIDPHISTEADVESPFSQSGFLADPWRSKMGHKYYEWLVFMKHCLGCIYCHEPEVMRVLMKRWKTNN